MQRMRSSFALALVVLASCGGCGEKKASPAPAAPAAPTTLTSASVAPPVPPAPPPSAARLPGTGDGWSAVVRGLRGRLVTTKASDSAGRPQLRLDLELENVTDSAAPIEIFWGDFGSMLRLELEDEAGTVLPKDAVGGSFASGPPHWLAVPVSSAIRMTISKAAYEYVPGGRVLLRPMTFQAWAVPATRTGKVFLRGTLTPPTSTEGSWTGALDLPRVALP
jgi:hypothetical protein